MEEEKKQSSDATNGMDVLNIDLVEGRPTDAI